MGDREVLDSQLHMVKIERRKTPIIPADRATSPKVLDRLCSKFLTALPGGLLLLPRIHRGRGVKNDYPTRRPSVKTLQELKGPARRRCMKLARLVRTQGVVYLRRDHEFRDAFRLHLAGLVTAAVSKFDLMGYWERHGKSWAFKELALFPTEAEALKRYETILPRRMSWA